MLYMKMFFSMFIVHPAMTAELIRMKFEKEIVRDLD